MPVRKRQSSLKSDDEDKDEKVLNPQLAEQPDVSEDELHQPPQKKRKYGKKKVAGVDRGDFNPDKGKLPEKTPLDVLREELSKQKDSAGKGKNVVYWMRMRDQRISDNSAISRASDLVKEHGNGAHLIALFILSPEDFVAHDRSPRRIDFVLRNLRSIKKDFDQLDIPFVVLSQPRRTAVVGQVLDLCKEWNASHLVGNIEYEVDELWRDIQTVQQASSKNIHADFLDDTYVIPPGKVLTKEGRPYSVFSPWNRNWAAMLAKDGFFLEERPYPSPNTKDIRSDKMLKGLFDQADIPDKVDGFECKDSDYMSKLWPAGEKSARRVLENFLSAKGKDDTLEPEPEEEKSGQVKPAAKGSRIERYATGRNLVGENGTSRLSPYLSAGIISARECLRTTSSLTNNNLKVGRDSGVAMYNTEISFRDFYGHVLAAWPRVCMGHAYILKYEDVVWEYDEEKLQAWKDGKTGYPIIDAAQRQGAKQGYMHNRARMCSAMFFTKHLMLDWRVGERWFMEHFIDGDFASNNGGWQWSASTGTDPQPYFRIFNPLSQSEKSDPTGDYIRHWLPELANVKGTAIHAPFDRLPRAEFDKLGYPKPIVEHRAARERALARFKNPGSR